MPPSTDPAPQVRVLSPTGMLGAGFAPETIEYGLTLNPDVIAVDGGSTDSGPYYLGAGVAKTTAAAVRRDLDILLRAAAGAGIPCWSAPAAPAAPTPVSTGSPGSPRA
ncbi:hypothetical protein SHKM778_50140 [Streptomyces sp. KM77-8]|uniref:Uncharacterized protein n=1 Tax=Streptomyces haneummycinicus TaxID=3074435 RepID=A0AAT9HM87_9ACTN